MGDKLKVAVLYEVWSEEAPPESEKAADSGRKRKEKEDREEIFEALTRLGHEPFYYVLDGRLQSLHGLAKCGADLVF
ncbi:MAG: D-alanine--D-alanine ligase, partial [Acidobacteria bacterium]|nr:D-alanine--D-alanine ligase [Acidobacteriota bacterium]